MSMSPARRDFVTLIGAAGLAVSFSDNGFAFEVNNPPKQDIENLRLAGRNGSFSAVALGAVRVEVTCAAMGQAVGTAAALCRKHRCAPRGIYNRHLKELQQQLLKNDQYIIGMVNEDPADRALSAKANASGSADPETGPENANIGNKKIRILVEQTHGSETAKIHEVRA
jgi:hypothetical protein